MHTHTRVRPATRRRRARLAAVTAVFGLVLGAAACSDDDDGSGAGAAAGTDQVTGGGDSGEPLRVGVLAPTTGPQTQLGTELVDGMEFYVEEHPDAAGRGIELIVEDTASEPQQGLSKAQKLVDSDDVDIVVGVVNSAVLEAVQDYLFDSGVPLVVSTAANDEFTVPEGNELGFRVGNSASQNNRVLGWYAYEELDMREVAILTYDFVAGDEMADAFSSVFTDLGGEIVSDQRATLGTQDYGSYISNISDDIDGLYVFLGGADAIRFWEQARDFGLTDRIQIIGAQPTLDPIVLDEVGDAAEGFVGPFQYLVEAPIPGNEDFVERYTDSVGRAPTFYAVDAYTTLQALTSAVESADGAALAEALPDVTFDEAPRGPFQFAPNHQGTYTVYVAEVVVSDGEPEYQILETVIDVDQEWGPESD